MDCTDATRGNETDWRERQFADTQALAHVGSWERRLPDARAQWSDELLPDLRAAAGVLTHA